MRDYDRHNNSVGLGLCAALLFLACPALAQQASTGAPQAGPVAGVAEGVIAATDVFLGRNSSGPYLLAWRIAEPDSDSVWRGPVRLQRGTDYTIDMARGVVAFGSPLKSSEIARVDYRYLPGKAQPNSSLVPTLFGFKLLDSSRGLLSLDATLRAGQASSGTSSGFSLAGVMLGLASTARLGSMNTITSRLYLNGLGGDLLGSSALQVSETSSGRLGKASLAFTRGGAGFASSQETGIAAGRQTLEAAANLNLSRKWQAATSLTQTDLLPAAGRGDQVTTLNQQLVGAITGALRMQASEAWTQARAAGGSTTEQGLTRLQLDDTVAPRTQATVSFERNRTDAAGATTIAQNEAVTVRSQSVRRLTLEGTFRSDLTSNGAQDAAGWRIQAVPTQRVSLSAAVSDSYGPSGATRMRQADVRYVPAKWATVTGSVVSHGDGAGDTVEQSLGATVRPSPFLELSGGMRVRDALQRGGSQPDSPDSRSLTFSLGGSRSRLKLTGGYTENPDDAGGAIARVTRRNVGIQSTLGPADLTTAYSLEQDDLLGRTSTLVDLQIGWRLARATRLTTGYKAALVVDQSAAETDAFSLGLTHRLGSAIDFSLSGVLTNYYRDRQLLAESDYRAESRLLVRF